MNEIFSLLNPSDPDASVRYPIVKDLIASLCFARFQNPYPSASPPLRASTQQWSGLMLQTALPEVSLMHLWVEIASVVLITTHFEEGWENLNPLFSRISVLLRCINTYIKMTYSATGRD